MVLSYYLALLKHPLFDIDAHLRVKFYCDWNRKDHSDNEDNKICLWMYGMNSRYISKAIANKTNREIEASIHIDKFWKFNNISQGYWIDKNSNTILNLAEKIKKNEPKIVEWIQRVILKKIYV